MKFMKQ